jgi:hypothetical protein
MKRIFGPKKDEATAEKVAQLSRFIFCTHPQISLGRSNQEE